LGYLVILPAQLSVNYSNVILMWQWTGWQRHSFQWRQWCAVGATGAEKAGSVDRHCVDWLLVGDWPRFLLIIGFLSGCLDSC